MEEVVNAMLDAIEVEGSYHCGCGSRGTGGAGRGRGGSGG